jgi:hypothetical protein
MIGVDGITRNPSAKALHRRTCPPTATTASSPPPPGDQQLHDATGRRASMLRQEANAVVQTTKQQNPRDLCRKPQLTKGTNPILLRPSLSLFVVVLVGPHQNHKAHLHRGGPTKHFKFLSLGISCQLLAPPPRRPPLPDEGEPRRIPWGIRA